MVRDGVVVKATGHLYIFSQPVLRWTSAGRSPIRQLMVSRVGNSELGTPPTANSSFRGCPAVDFIWDDLPPLIQCALSRTTPRVAAVTSGILRPRGGGRESAGRYCHRIPQQHNRRLACFAPFHAVEPMLCNVRPWCGHAPVFRCGSGTIIVLQSKPPGSPLSTDVSALAGRISVFRYFADTAPRRTSPRWFGWCAGLGGSGPELHQCRPCRPQSRSMPSNDHSVSYISGFVGWPRSYQRSASDNNARTTLRRSIPKNFVNTRTRGKPSWKLIWVWSAFGRRIVNDEHEIIISS